MGRVENQNLNRSRRERLRHGIAAVCVLLLFGAVAACSLTGGQTVASVAGSSLVSESTGHSDPPPTESTTTTKEPKPTLRGGEVNKHVLELQRVLNFRGYPVPEDGVYGDVTQEAIKRYQAWNGLWPDGVVNDATWFALAFPHPTTTTTAPPTTRPPTTRAAPPTTRPPAPSQPAPFFPSGPVNRAVVRLATQQVELYDGFILKAKFPMSSGANGATPRGSFRVFRKVPMATSSDDPLVTMPFMTNFNEGIGFHGIPVKNKTRLYTPLGQYPVSHGCIRLADANAKWVQDNLPIGSPVDVV